MAIKLLILTLIVSVASAQKVVKGPIIIRNEDFKKGTTFDVALDQIYKRIIPKKSTKDPAKCFWMLGDKKYLNILNKIHEAGVKHIYFKAPMPFKVAPPLIPLPKKKPLPASPHRQ